jgi:hypothetical protein
MALKTTKLTLPDRLHEVCPGAFDRYSASFCRDGLVPVIPRARYVLQAYDYKYYNKSSWWCVAQCRGVLAERFAC